MGHGSIPIVSMSRQDYTDFQHILEKCHETESNYDAGAVIFRSEDMLPMVPLFDINVVSENTKIKFRKFELVKELATSGTFSIYSVPQAAEVSVGQYFKRFKGSLGTTALEVYENVWKKIDSSKKNVVYKYEYSVDNAETISSGLQFLNLKELTEKSLLGQFDEETKKIEGIFSPYAHYGVPGSIAGLHIEDSDMMSLNVHIWGGPKHWLTIGEANRERVVELMAKSDSTFKNYPHHYRCKLMVISPSALEREQISTFCGFQHENDIVATLCGGFHQITNCGM